MALIKCRDCGTEVSSSADKCLKCGAPVKRMPSIWKFLRWVLIAIVVAPIAVCSYMTGTAIDQQGRAEDESRQQSPP